MTRRFVVWLALAAMPACGHGAPEYEGTVVDDTSVVGFRVDGRVDVVMVHRGDRVHAGDVVARLDDSDARRALAARQADADAARAEVARLEAPPRPEDVAALARQLAVAQAEEEVARRDMERQKQLYEACGTRKDLDASIANLERATADRKAIAARLALLRGGPSADDVARAKDRRDEAERALSSATDRVAACMLVATTETDVVDVVAAPGVAVPAGAAVLRVADTAHPHVEIRIPLDRVAIVHAGDRADVHRAGQDDHFAAIVDGNPTLDGVVRVRLDDPDRRLGRGRAFVRLDR
jgi:HlyD family secretion protein